MDGIERKAVVRDWTSLHGWSERIEDMGDRALIACVDNAIEREFHRTGASEYLHYYGIL